MDFFFGLVYIKEEEFRMGVSSDWSCAILSRHDTQGKDTKTKIA